MSKGFIVRRGTPPEPELFIDPGLIVEWFGLSNSIPDGWELCDGSNNTPNLVDKFIVGAGDTYAIGNTGGFADGIVPTHNHTSSNTNTTGSHSHTMALIQSTGSGGQNRPHSGQGVGYQSNALPIGFSGNHSHSSVVSTVGDSATDKNLPPYLGLFHIIKVEE
jgi:hypothetical protein